MPCKMGMRREGLDETGNFKKTATFLHQGGVQEFVELMTKDKAPLHPDMKVSAAGDSGIQDNRYSNLWIIELVALAAAFLLGVGWGCL